MDCLQQFGKKNVLGIKTNWSAPEEGDAVYLIGLENHRGLISSPNSDVRIKPERGQKYKVQRHQNKECSE